MSGWDKGGRGAGDLAEAEHVADELFPEEEEAAKGVAEVAVAGEADDALVEVVVDLAPHLVLDVVLGFVGVGDAEGVGADAAAEEELAVVLEDLVEAVAFTGHVVPVDLGVAFEGGREGEVGGAPDAALIVLGGDADEGEGDVLLFAEADGGDGLLLGVPEDAEELLHAGPFPTAVGGVFEAFLVHCGDGFGGVGEKGIGGGGAEAEAVVERETEAADAGEEFEPGEEEPGRGAGEADEDVFGEEVGGGEAADEEGEGTEFSCAEVPAGAQGHGQHKKAGDKNTFPHFRSLRVGDELRRQGDANRVRELWARIWLNPMVLLRRGRVWGLVLRRGTP